MKPSVLVFATLALPLAARAQNVPDQHQVVPGERIGRVFLGDSQAAVHRRLGKPTANFRLPQGLDSELWKAKDLGAHGLRDTLQVIYRSGVAVQIEVANPVFQMNNGLNVESDFQKRFQIFGRPNFSARRIARRHNAKQLYQDWKRSGVAIELLCTEIQPGHEGEPVPETLIVHRKGQPVIPAPGVAVEP